LGASGGVFFAFTSFGSLANAGAANTTVVVSKAMKSCGRFMTTFFDLAACCGLL
jgi:hypothetical protein